MIWIIIIAVSIFIVGDTIVQAERNYHERQVRMDKIGRK